MLQVASLDEPHASSPERAPQYQPTPAHPDENQSNEENQWSDSENEFGRTDSHDKFFGVFAPDPSVVPMPVPWQQQDTLRCSLQVTAPAQPKLRVIERGITFL